MAGEKSRSYHAALFAADGAGLGSAPDRLAGIRIAGARQQTFRITCSDLKSRAARHGADFAIGLVNYQPANPAVITTAMLVLSDVGDGWYYKRHLVPFGEYFPVPAFVRSLDAADEFAL